MPFWLLKVPWLENKVVCNLPLNLTSIDWRAKDKRLIIGPLNVETSTNVIWPLKC